MDFLVGNWLVIVGVVIGIGAIVDTIFNSAKLIRQIAILLYHAPKWVWGRWLMFREWRRWEKYCPSCEIVQTSKLWIKKPSNRYYMRLKIDVRYTSRDNRYDTSIDITSVNLDVYNTGKGRDSKPYRLCRSSVPLKIYPEDDSEDSGEGWFPLIQNVWELPHGGNVVVRYTFEGFIDAPPRVDASTFCKIVAIGKAKVGAVLGTRELKIDGKFVVDVEYEKEVNI